MPDKKFNVVIFVEIGGLLAGLMQGIIIKRLGHDVTILEQHLSSTREGQAAGIVTMENSDTFMSAHDLLKEQLYAVQCSGVQFLDKHLKVVGGFDRPMCMSSWNVFYYPLRANFNCLTSSYCKILPSEPVKDGKAVYDQGNSVKDIRYDDGSVIIDFEDLMNNASDGRDSIRADLAIAADGSPSRILQVLQPHLKHTYAGYIAWRGTVLESDISEETRNTFKLKTTLHATTRSYIALYAIRGENGTLEPGKRHLNFIWYTNIAEGSPELAETMTDSSGKKHRHTLPIGKMQKAVSEKQRALASRVLPAPFAVLIDKIAQPFVSSIVDIGVSKPSFFDGKLLMVGDALVPFRPHVACSTNQVALDALLVVKMLSGEISLAAWESQVADYAQLTRLQSITWGSWYQFGYVAFFFSEARFRLAGYASRIRKYWQS